MTATQGTCPGALAVKRLFTAENVLCDGAMGTMLLDGGASMDRCLDELNLTHPERVRGVHTQYLEAGAEVIETNTFGANRLRLQPCGLGGEVRAINLAGARLARECVGERQAFVAGAIGPLGVRPELVSLTEARAVFAEQVRALAEGGVDLLMVETMMSLAEAGQAILAARAEAPQLPLIVMMTVDAAGNCLDGASPEFAAERLTELGADAVGCNCSFGPAGVWSAIARMRSATTLPLAAMPNAGLPRLVEGRSVYLCSPQEMAGYARKLVEAGASFVGGCCGTTPAHTRAMRDALRGVAAFGEDGMRAEMLEVFE